MSEDPKTVSLSCTVYPWSGHRWTQPTRKDGGWQVTGKGSRCLFSVASHSRQEGRAPRSHLWDRWLALCPVLIPIYPPPPFIMGTGREQGWRTGVRKSLLAVWMLKQHSSQGSLGPAALVSESPLQSPWARRFACLSLILPNRPWEGQLTCPKPGSQAVVPSPVKWAELVWGIIKSWSHRASGYERQLLKSN